ncbi:unnamed protein product [Anisakis simplex]|uniref:polynucleotide adenylyltransferase n=1 Tax=Anisakis simplex TaxID=6269 RepID=A0A0M3JSL5_ANISI|nr:unnamed protein product [Anisakis simplex]
MQLTEESDSVSVSSSDDEELRTVESVDLCDRVLWPSSKEHSLIANAPWCRKRYHLSLYGLHEEIIDLYRWLRPSPLEKALRYCVFERVRSVIERVWPTAKVAVFGSLFTNLFLPTSDIDVVVEIEHLDEPPLWKTAESLKASGIAETITVLDKAFVPIVKMVDKDTKIFLDISFNTSQGVRTAKYIEQMKSRYPVLEPLVLILKQFLMQRQLNQVFTGGLSSYGLILMLISFLQLHHYDFSHKSIHDVNMGMILLSFLQLYGQEFNYLTTALRVRDGGAYVCKEEMITLMSRPSNSMLCIEDPLQPGNDIGRCSHNILFVRQAFDHALCTLGAAFIRSRESSHADWMKHYGGSLLSQIVSISSRHIRYRNWLSGRVLSDANYHPSNNNNKLTSPLSNPSSASTPLDAFPTLPPLSTSIFIQPSSDTTTNSNNPSSNQSSSCTSPNTCIK